MPVGERPASAAFLGPAGAGERKLPPRASQDGSGDRRCLSGPEEGRWSEKGRIPARPDVFQVGPLLSPKADRLLFAQADGALSGEMFVVDLAEGADWNWPPSCSPVPTPR
jgi:hypothetical protein